MSVELPTLPPTKLLSLHWHEGQWQAFGHDADQMCAYATEALKARKPLTDEQVAQIMRGLNESLSGYRGWGWIDVARAIERAHGIGE